MQNVVQVFNQKKTGEEPIKKPLIKRRYFYQKKKKEIHHSVTCNFFYDHKIFTPRAFARTFFNAPFTSLFLKV